MIPRDKFTFMQVLSDMRHQLIAFLKESSPDLSHYLDSADSKLQEDISQILFEDYLSAIGDHLGLTFDDYDTIIMDETLEQVLGPEIMKRIRCLILYVETL